MKKKVFGKKLGRSFTAKKALFRSLTRAIVIYGEINTTKAKAKAVGPFIENLIVMAKKGDIPSRRRVYSILANDRKTTDKIFEIAKNFKEQKGGYLKVINLPLRKGDSAPMVKIQWSNKIEEPVKAKTTKKSEKEDKSKKIQPKKILKKVSKADKKSEKSNKK
jgi:large subunit ribosomal protein L17